MLTRIILDRLVTMRSNELWQQGMFHATASILTCCMSHGRFWTRMGTPVQHLRISGAGDTSKAASSLTRNPGYNYQLIIYIAGSPPSHIHLSSQSLLRHACHPLMPTCTPKMWNLSRGFRIMRRRLPVTS